MLNLWSSSSLGVPWFKLQLAWHCPRLNVPGGVPLLPACLGYGQPVHMESIAVDVVWRGARSSHFRYTRYPRYTGHRITKIRPRPWDWNPSIHSRPWCASAATAAWLGWGRVCVAATSWWSRYGPAQCWKPHHAQSCIGFPEVCKRCYFSVLSNCTMDLHPKN